ncbi:FtsB family cell division protein [Cerasicoccus fimbriatus]|uniref:FtsB family cell division protein n=1 Tax=Cerasicoccus fimbriatus TaxID=3014554 RepID=UPI0022B38837|nr:septum formation initiator family protein [Cerasicoccus sp. TK19100]
MRKYQLILPALAVALAGACAVFGVVLMQSWREHQAFQERNEAAHARLIELKENNAAQQAYLTELQSNPDMVERAARERLGYSREGELIFKFDR